MFFLDYRFLFCIPLAVIVYWLAGARLRNAILLAANVAWLAVFSPSTLIALVALTIGVVYPFALFASRAYTIGSAQDKRHAKVLSTVGIAILIAVTVALRLHTYFLPDVVLSATPLGNELLHWIGFSYFLLKGIHVLFATSRGIVAMPSLWTLVQYVLFLPTLTSGPIYRVGDFDKQLAEPKRLTWDHVQDGLVRILIGMAKKVVAVPFLTSWAVDLHGRGIALQPAAYTLTYVMLFLDFSGYSDIAIGVGRLLGFTVPENFKSPFTATTLTQFWRNWHATLGDWLRENLFIPLGGMRAKGWQLAAIVVSSMIVVGIWHGFRGIFLGWGLYHGTALLLENKLKLRPLHTHKTPWWRLGLRYAFVQAVVIGGMFMFIGGPNIT